MKRDGITRAGGTGKHLTLDKMGETVDGERKG